MPTNTFTDYCLALDAYGIVLFGVPYIPDGEISISLSEVIDVDLKLAESAHQNDAEPSQFVENLGEEIYLNKNGKGNSDKLALYRLGTTMRSLAYRFPGVLQINSKNLQSPIYFIEINTSQSSYDAPFTITIQEYDQQKRILETGYKTPEECLSRIKSLDDNAIIK